MEYGEPGERALRQAGPDAADVVFGDFSDADLAPAGGRRSRRRTARWPWPCSTSMPPDPDFREILRTHGAAIIPPIAQADAGPETLAYLGAKTRRSFTESLALAALFASGDNGQATIRTIKNDGLERVAQLNQSEIQFYQFLPLYDVIHLGNVVRRGYAPTSGEMTWALVDGCFVVADVLSLAAVQPEGAVAAESIRDRGQGRGTRGGQVRGPRAGRDRRRVGRQVPGPSRDSHAVSSMPAPWGPRACRGGWRDGGPCDRPVACTRSCGESPRPCRGSAWPR